MEQVGTRIHVRKLVALRLCLLKLLAALRAKFLSSLRDVPLLCPLQLSVSRHGELPQNVLSVEEAPYLF
jgi:hypothetical protein